LLINEALLVFPAPASQLSQPVVTTCNFELAN